MGHLLQYGRIPTYFLKLAAFISDHFKSNTFSTIFTHLHHNTVMVYSKRKKKKQFLSTQPNHFASLLNTFKLPFINHRRLYIFYFVLVCSHSRLTKNAIGFYVKMCERVKGTENVLNTLSLFLALTLFRFCCYTKKKPIQYNHLVIAFSCAIFGKLLFVHVFTGTDSCARQNISWSIIRRNANKLK